MEKRVVHLKNKEFSVKYFEDCGLNGPTEQFWIGKFLLVLKTETRLYCKFCSIYQSNEMSLEVIYVSKNKYNQ